MLGNFSCRSFKSRFTSKFDKTYSQVHRLREWGVDQVNILTIQDDGIDAERSEEDDLSAKKDAEEKTAGELFAERLKRSFAEFETEEPVTTSGTEDLPLVQRQLFLEKVNFSTRLAPHSRMGFFHDELL